MTADLPGRWVLASGNRGKLRELRALLAPVGRILIGQGELGITSPAETGLTFVENALLKARHAAGAAAMPAIADDSGLMVDALHGEPGIRSARYAGPEASDQENVDKLLDALANVADPARSASFYCVVVGLRDAWDPAPVIAAGRWRGHIALKARGEGGFGYDPVFVGLGLGQTAAELAPEHKNRISHRAQALNGLLAALGAAP